MMFEHTSHTMQLFLALMYGVTLGVLYFAMLSLSVFALIRHSGSVIWLLGSALLRLSFVLLVIYWLITHLNTAEWLASIGGFLVLRASLLHFLHTLTPTSQKLRNTQELQRSPEISRTSKQSDSTQFGKIT